MMPRLRCVLLWSDITRRTKAQDQLEDIRQENKSNRESPRLSECLCQLYFKNDTDHDIHDRYDIQKKKPAISPCDLVLDVHVIQRDNALPSRFAGFCKDHPVRNDQQDPDDQADIPVRCNGRE